MFKVKNNQDYNLRNSKQFNSLGPKKTHDFFQSVDVIFQIRLWGQN
jgi:hypothetical protein